MGSENRSCVGVQRNEALRASENQKNYGILTGKGKKKKVGWGKGICGRDVLQEEVFRGRGGA